MNISGNNTEGNYQLRLSNGHVWDFHYAADTREWVERFVTILSLSQRRPKKNAFSVNFCRKQSAGLKHNSEVMVEIPSNQTFIKDVFLMWKTIHLIYAQAIVTGGIPIHAALIERKGKGILLAAPGGTGKSTCCRRLPSGWTAICDDETLLFFTKDCYVAHPFPTWSNFYLKRSPQSWDVGSSYPVNAVFFLQQSETDQIKPLGQGSSAALIYQASSQICRRLWRDLDDENLMIAQQNLFGLASDMALRIPGFKLNVSLSGNFWELIDDALEFESIRRKGKQID